MPANSRARICPLFSLQLHCVLVRARPAVQADGGDLVLLGTEGGTVNIQMVGACGGCPLSMMTLKAGIERILKDRVPGVSEVNASANSPGLDANQVGGIQIPAL